MLTFPSLSRSENPWKKPRRTIEEKDEERTDTIINDGVTVEFLPNDNKEKDRLVADGLAMKHMNDNREKEEKEEERRKSKEVSNQDVDGG